MKYQTYLRGVKRCAIVAHNMLNDYVYDLRQNSRKADFRTICFLFWGVESKTLDYHIHSVQDIAEMLSVPEEFVVRSDARSAGKVFAEWKNKQQENCRQENNK